VPILLIFSHSLTHKQVDRSILPGESVVLFRAAIRNVATRDPYERRLIAFLNSVGTGPDSFVELAKKKPKIAEKNYLVYN
jgi:hypothetical protein